MDATDQVDQIKVIKSPEEIYLIRRTAELQDAAIEHLKTFIKPGLRVFEVYAKALRHTTLSGSGR